MITRTAALNELARREADRELARRHFLTGRRLEDGWQYAGFVPHFPPAPNYKIGLHTWVIAHELELATRRVEAGKCHYAMIHCPHRHGKSRLISGRYPCWHLGRNPDHEIMMASYSAANIEPFSRIARRLIEQEPEYQCVFPNVKMSQESHSVSSWEIAGHAGVLNAVGLTGSVLGKGAHVLIVDDPHKGWRETRSIAVRDTVWRTFLQDCMTRLAPVHAVIVLMTLLHEDDLGGRLVREMRENLDFPHFRVLKFPARSAKYKSGWLFPERFSPEWYEQQYATLGAAGPAMPAAMLDLEPVVEGGARFDVNRIRYASASEVPGGLRWCRYWDLASTEEERQGSRTAGALVAVEVVSEETPSGAIARLPRLWVKDMLKGHWEAPERDRIIVQTAQADGMGVSVVLETVGGYKDTADRIARELHGFATVTGDAKTQDKVMRAEALEPVMAAGNVVFVRGDWNYDAMQELTAFPMGKYKDQVDALTGGFHHLHGGEPEWFAETGS